LEKSNTEVPKLFLKIENLPYNGMGIVSTFTKPGV